MLKLAKSLSHLAITEMPAVLSKDYDNGPKVFSLWARAGADWHHLDTASDESVLHLNAESLKKLFTTKQFLIIPGASAPTL